MDEKELQALYEAMGKKLGLPDFKSFRNQLESDDKFRKAFYNEASSELELGDYNSFDSKVKKKLVEKTQINPPPFPNLLHRIILVLKTHLVQKFQMQLGRILKVKTQLH